jgi:hypothetical protein
VNIFLFFWEREDFMNRFFMYAFALLLMGCATTDSQWVQQIDGNQFEITSGRLFNSQFVTVTNTRRTWDGDLKGDKDMVPARKKILVDLAKAEAAKICGDDGFEPVGEPTFNMQERDPMAFGGGILGVLIAEATSSYKNIPVSGRYEFNCLGEEKKDG